MTDATGGLLFLVVAIFVVVWVVALKVDSLARRTDRLEHILTRHRRAHHTQAHRIPEDYILSENQSDAAFRRIG